MADGQAEDEMDVGEKRRARTQVFCGQQAAGSKCLGRDQEKGTPETARDPEIERQKRLAICARGMGEPVEILMRSAGEAFTRVKSRAIRGRQMCVCCSFIDETVDLKAQYQRSPHVCQDSEMDGRGQVG